MLLSPWHARHSAPGWSSLPPAARTVRSENRTEKTVARTIATITPRRHSLCTIFVSAIANSRPSFTGGLPRKENQRLKPIKKRTTYRSGKLLRHPKSNTASLPTHLSKTGCRSCLFHAQTGKHFRIFLSDRQQVVACVAVVGDSLATGAGVTAVMAAETVRRIIVAEIVRVRAAVHAHVSENVAQVDICHFLAMLLHQRVH